MKKSLFGWLLVLALLLAACGQSSPDTPKTVDLEGTQEALNQELQSSLEAAQTLFAQQTQDAGGSEATATSTPTPESTATNTPQASATPTATSTSEPTATSTPVCNAADFISDITVADGTDYDAKDTFTKTWRIQNAGSCTWDDDYTVRYVGGTNLASKSSYSLSEEVSPGETIDISISMTAPDDAGSYTSSWKLYDGDGNAFGVGSTSVAFYASITVDGTATAETNNGEYDLTSNACNASWSSATGSLPCPGEDDDDDGFIIKTSNIDLEHMTASKTTLWVHPNESSGGYIKGVYPAIEIEASMRFKATVGCLEDYGKCDIRFELMYIKSNGTIKSLGSWAEEMDGGVREININLSSLEGQTVQFVLYMESRSSKYTHAQGFWYRPRVVD